MTENANAANTLFSRFKFSTASLNWKGPAIFLNGAKVNTNYRKCGHQACTIQHERNFAGMVVSEICNTVFFSVFNFYFRNDI